MIAKTDIHTLEAAGFSVLTSTTRALASRAHSSGRDAVEIIALGGRAFNVTAWTPDGFGQATVSRGQAGRKALDLLDAIEQAASRRPRRRS